MDASLNLVAIIVANIMGITILGVTRVGHRWQLKSHSRENAILTFLTVISISGCIIDPTASLASGHAGTVFYVINWAGNWWLYFTNLLTGPAWVLLICEHLHVPLSKARLAFLAVVDAVCLIPLLMNFFTPVVFGIGDDQCYFRGPLYWLYVVIEMLLILDGVVVYLKAKHRGGMLKFFPVWLFCAPAVIGIILQSIFYGISTIWPFIAISMSGVMSCIQNEMLFRDHLTGLFNRSYLDYVKQAIKSTHQRTFTAIMLDLNNFKSINDNYGHSEGDEALIEAGHLLTGAVGTLGSVIRYAGDEFIVLLNTQDEAQVQHVIDMLHTRTNSFNANSGKPWSLSFSLGYSAVDLSRQTVDELINEIDAKMFQNKREFYRSNPRMNRRTR